MTDLSWHAIWTLISICFDFTFYSLLVSGRLSQFQLPSHVFLHHFLYLGMSLTKICSKTHKPRQNLPQEDFSRHPSPVSPQVCHPPFQQEQLKHSFSSFLLKPCLNTSPSIAPPIYHQEFCPCFEQTKWQLIEVWISNFGNISSLKSLYLNQNCFPRQLEGQSLRLDLFWEVLL